MRLVFLDDAAGIATLGPGEVLVATEPDVEVAAEAAGRDFLRLWGFVAPSLLEDDGDTTWEPLIAACDSLEPLLRPDASALWHLRDLKMLVDNVRCRWLAARSMLAELQPSSAALRLARGTLTYAVLAHGLEASGVAVDATRSPQSGRPVAAPVSSSLHDRVSWLMHRPRRRGAPLILCSDSLYTVPAVAAALRGAGCEVRLLVPAPEPVRPVSIPTSALTSFAGLFEVHGVDLGPVGLPRVASLLETGLAESAAAYRGARRTIDRERPAGVLGSAFQSARLKAIAAAARDASVPVFVSRHGEMGIRINRFGVYQDLDAVDVALCWGEWERRQVEAFAPRPVRTRVVGSPLLEEEAPSRAELRAELGFSESELVVLYLFAGFGNGVWVASHRSPIDSEHMRHRHEVVAALASVPEVRPVIKMPTSAPSASVLAWLLAAAPGIRTLSGRPYSELVHLPDVVVIDFPSTTLVQALRGSARIVIPEHPVMKWMPGVRDHLTGHGVSFVAPAELGDWLADEQVAGRLAGPHVYAPAAVEPLLASGRGTAADRAARALLELVSA